jgi:hypothetical protein
MAHFQRHGQFQPLRSVPTANVVEDSERAVDRVLPNLRLTESKHSTDG